ncbi:hypothetical protein Droror1_Dr00017814 [Drosera rotundifolia]
MSYDTNLRSLHGEKSKARHAATSPAHFHPFSQPSQRSVTPATEIETLALSLPKHLRCRLSQPPRRLSQPRRRLPTHPPGCEWISETRSIHRFPSSPRSSSLRNETRKEIGDFFELDWKLLQAGLEVSEVNRECGSCRGVGS